MIRIAFQFKGLDAIPYTSITLCLEFGLRGLTLHLRYLLLQRLLCRSHQSQLVRNLPFCLVFGNAGIHRVQQGLNHLTCRLVADESGWHIFIQTDRGRRECDDGRDGGGLGHLESFASASAKESGDIDVGGNEEDCDDCECGDGVFRQ